MSDLRKHLEAEKARHQGFVYPGNLAADLLGAAKAKPASVMDYADAALGRRSSVLKWMLGFGSLAAAAVVALFIYTHHVTAPVNPVGPEVALNSKEEEIPIAPDQTASINDIEVQSIVPSDVDTLVPEYQSMTLPTVPSFSDLSTPSDENTQPSREAV